jgi:hypothetical protein
MTLFIVSEAKAERASATLTPRIEPTLAGKRAAISCPTKSPLALNSSLAFLQRLDRGKAGRAAISINRRTRRFNEDM